MQRTNEIESRRENTARWRSVRSLCVDANRKAYRTTAGDCVLDNRALTMIGQRNDRQLQFVAWNQGHSGTHPALPALEVRLTSGVPCDKQERERSGPSLVRVWQLAAAHHQHPARRSALQENPAQWQVRALPLHLPRATRPQRTLQLAAAALRLQPRALRLRRATGAPALHPQTQAAQAAVEC